MVIPQRVPERIRARHRDRPHRGSPAVARAADSQPEPPREDHRRSEPVSGSARDQVDGRPGRPPAQRREGRAGGARGRVQRQLHVPTTRRRPRSSPSGSPRSSSRRTSRTAERLAQTTSVFLKVRLDEAKERLIEQEKKLEDVPSRARRGAAVAGRLEPAGPAVGARPAADARRFDEPRARAAGHQGTRARRPARAGAGRAALPRCRPGAPRHRHPAARRHRRRLPAEELAQARAQLQVDGRTPDGRTSRRPAPAPARRAARGAGAGAEVSAARHLGGGRRRAGAGADAGRAAARAANPRLARRGRRDQPAHRRAAEGPAAGCSRRSTSIRRGSRPCRSASRSRSS